MYIIKFIGAMKIPSLYSLFTHYMGIWTWMDGWIATLANKTPHLHDIINRHFFNIYIVRLHRIR